MDRKVTDEGEERKKEITHKPTEAKFMKFMKKKREEGESEDE